MPDLPKHKFARVASSAKVADASRLYAMMIVGGSGAAGTLKVMNTANGSGDPTVECAAVTGATTFVDFSLLGPVILTTALYVTLAGSGAVAYVWYD